MYCSKKIVCIIPARLASTRFPRKVLSFLGKIPLLQRVYQAALSCSFFDEVVIAVDDIETLKLTSSFNAKAVMTSTLHQNGTERLIEVKNKHHIEADIYVNWQADEPFICSKMIEDLLQSCDEPSDVWTLRKKITDHKEILDPTVVKVIVNQQEQALYFSRSPIPFNRDKELDVNYYKHIGLYAYSSKALDEIQTFKSCEIEKAESLEQLRFLYHGLTIKVHETEYQTLGIDLPIHLEEAEKRLVGSV